MSEDKKDFFDYDNYIKSNKLFQKINLGPLSEIKLNIPSDIKEQEAIASVLSDMDNEIESLEHKLEKTRQIKQGMMQQLLTGKIRLV